MFVIVQSLDNLESRPGERPEERVARALEHAGVSILVTSITDAATFFIGSTSVCNIALSQQFIVAYLVTEHANSAGLLLLLWPGGDLPFRVRLHLLCGVFAA